MLRRIAAAAVLGAAWISAVAIAAAPPPPTEIEALTKAIDAAAREEIASKQVPSIAVALVDASGVVWSSAWGHADADGKVPAAADTVYRAGSVSKLFTDIAVMRLVEQGKIDLDTPVTAYLPEFKPHNPFGTPITLRHLMTHRSGLVREPVRGHYFDADAADQADAVASLNQTTLVAAPGTITKYSNAGIAVVGEVVARVSAMPYEQAISRLVLEPLGMDSSAMTAASLPQGAAYSQMAAFDGPRLAAPTFDLGTPAAGNLYTTTSDLGRFITVMLNRAALPGGTRLLKPASLEEMWRQQFPQDGKRAFGLGFVLGKIDGQRTVGHTGAVYGHVTDLRFMPETGIGVVVFGTVDAGTSASKIASFALRGWMAAKSGQPLPAFTSGTPVTGSDAKRLSGWFTDGHASVVTRVFDGRLVIDGPLIAGEVRRDGDHAWIEDAQSLQDDLVLSPKGEWLELGGKRYTRAIPPEPPLPDPDLAAVIGEYGWDHNILRIYQRDGAPYARIEWIDYEPLRKVSSTRYAFPEDRGLYPREELRFERDKAGHVTAALLSGIRFARRDFGAETQARVRAMVSANADALRTEAMKAAPPAEPAARSPSHLTALTDVDPSIRLDIRYAGTDNFMGIPLYEKAAAFMQHPAAKAVANANASLRIRGYGLLIHDAYRPWFVTKMFWDATPAEGKIFVADPSQGSRHNRGAAVDLTLFSLTTGEAVEMTGRYDEMSSRSYSNFIGGSDHERWLREVLRSAMEAQDFDVYPQEWWHFDFASWRDYPIGNASFTQLGAKSAE